MAFNGLNTNTRVPELRHFRRRTRLRHSRRLNNFIAFENSRLTVAASDVLTAAGIPANADVVTVGGKTYTFQTALTNVDGNVLIGASAATALANLQAAINLAAGAGTTYAALTTANANVTAPSITATTLTAQAKVGGTAGNAIAATKTSANLSWAAATLLGGVTPSVAASLKKNSAITIDNVALNSTLK